MTPGRFSLTKAFQSACPRRHFAKSSGAIAFRPSMRINVRVMWRRIFMTAGIFLLNCGAERAGFIVLRFMPKTLHKHHKESIGFLLVFSALIRVIPYFPFGLFAAHSL